jgi:hypothetical protein
MPIKVRAKGSPIEKLSSTLFGHREDRKGFSSEALDASLYPNKS